MPTTPSAEQPQPWHTVGATYGYILLLTFVSTFTSWLNYLATDRSPTQDSYGLFVFAKNRYLTDGTQIGTTTTNTPAYKDLGSFFSYTTTLLLSPYSPLLIIIPAALWVALATFNLTAIGELGKPLTQGEIKTLIPLYAHAIPFGCPIAIAIITYLKKDDIGIRGQQLLNTTAFTAWWAYLSYTTYHRRQAKKLAAGNHHPDPNESHSTEEKNTTKKTSEPTPRTTKKSRQEPQTHKGETNAESSALTEESNNFEHSTKIGGAFLITTTIALIINSKALWKWQTGWPNTSFLVIFVIATFIAIITTARDTGDYIPAMQHKKPLNATVESLWPLALLFATIILPSLTVWLPAAFTSITLKEDNWGEAFFLQLLLPAITTLGWMLDTIYEMRKGPIPVETAGSPLQTETPITERTPTHLGNSIATRNP